MNLLSRHRRVTRTSSANWSPGSVPPCNCQIKLGLRWNRLVQGGSSTRNAPIGQTRTDEDPEFT